MAEDIYEDPLADQANSHTGSDFLVELFYTLLDGRWVILADTALTLFCSVIYHSSKPNLYAASVQVLVERVDNTPKTYQEMILPTFRGEEDYYGTQIEIL